MSSGFSAVCHPKLKPDLYFTAGEKGLTTKSTFPRDGRSRFTRVKLRISRFFSTKSCLNFIGFGERSLQKRQIVDWDGRRLKILGQITQLLAITIASNNPLTHFGCNQHANQPTKRLHCRMRREPCCSDARERHGLPALLRDRHRLVLPRQAAGREKLQSCCCWLPHLRVKVIPI